MAKNAICKLNIRLKRTFRFFTSTLQRKLIINHFLLIIIPVLTIFYFIFSTYTSDKRREAVNLTHIANGQAMERIESLIEVMEELTKQPIYDAAARSQSPTNRDPGILEILKESNREGMINQDEGGIIPESEKNDPAVTYARTTAENRVVDKLLKRLLLFNENVHSVFLFNKFGRYEYRMEQYSLDKTLYCAVEPWFQKCMDLRGRTHVFIGDGFLKNMRNFADKEYHFSIARAVMDTQSVIPLGIICINIDKGFFQATCSSIMTMRDERVLILDENDIIIYDTAEADANRTNLDISAIIKSDIGSSFPINGENYLVDIVTSTNLSWKLVHIIPEDILYTNLKTMQRQFMLLIMISVMLSLVLSVSLSIRITKPMKRLIAAMRVVEKGDLSIRYPARRKDEIGLLARSFNKMIRKIENLVNIVYISQIRKKEAELDALQSQINPHFIYNSLESIRMMAELNDDNETSRMTFMLARLLRYSISVKKQKVTVEQEIEHLKNYLELQNMRYDNKFELVEDLDEELLNVSIIKLVFQPVVENSISHGFDGTEGKGVIRISRCHENGRIVFRIEDNGKGMSEEQVEDLNRKINDFSQNDGEKGGIGLKNVNERIRLHYGEGFGIKLLSEPGNGTIVVFEFPDREAMNRISV